VLEFNPSQALNPYSKGASTRMDDPPRMQTNRRLFRSSVVTILLALLAAHATMASALGNTDEESSRSAAEVDPSADCPDKGPDPDLIEIPAALQRVVPKDAVLIGWYGVDLNLDGKQDAIVVVEKDCNDRTLLLAIRQRDGSLSVAASNDHLILCAGCTGAEGGYDINTAPGRFTVSQHFGTGTLQQSEDVTFVWSKKRHTWIVKEAKSSASDVKKEDSTIETDQKSAVAVTFEDYQSQL
jgi:hypothetical protein